MSEEVYYDAAIASNDAVMEHFGNGQPLEIDGVSYPIRTPTELQTVRNFIAICEDAGSSG